MRAIMTLALVLAGLGGPAALAQPPSAGVPVPGALTGAAREDYVANSVAGCEDEARTPGRTTFDPRQAASYCRCVAEAMADLLTEAELKAAWGGFGEAPPAARRFTEVARAVAPPCRDRALRLR